jgi:hypothetical protein
VTNTLAYLLNSANYKHQISTSFKALDISLKGNIRLGCEFLSVTNTLAYFQMIVNYNREAILKGKDHYN